MDLSNNYFFETRFTVPPILQNLRQYRENDEPAHSNNVDLIYDVISQYNENIRNYNSIIDRLVNMLHTEIHPPHRRNTFRFRPARNRSTIPLRSSPVSNTLSQLENNLMYQTTAAYIINILRRGENNQLLFNEFEDVEVIPTPTQIAHATQIIEYDSSVNYANSSCPITLDYFEDGELICMIRHCKHIFKNVK